MPVAHSSSREKSVGSGSPGRRSGVSRLGPVPAGRARGFEVLAAEPGERGGAKLLEELPASGFELEMPGGEPRHGIAVEPQAVGGEDFRGGDAAQLVVERLRRNFGDAQLSRSEERRGGKGG